MKPLNLDNKPCSPISSNCVIWQGPDIPCINLCKGDTVSDVVHKLAEELCCVLTILDINSYDLSCFNLTSSKPKDFKAFIQFLAEKICELEGISVPCGTNLTLEGDGCPTDCIITVADPFQTPESSTMNLVEYSSAMGQKIADNITEIGINKSAIANHEVRITGLEVAPPPTFTLPSITPDCVLPSVPTPIDQVLDALESNYCNYISNMGSIVDITAAVGQECAGLAGSTSRVNPAQSMVVEYAGTWRSGATTLAESMNNLWITVCDMRNATPVTVSVADTETVDLTITAGPAYQITADLTDTGWVNLEGFAYYPVSINQPQVRKIGKVLHFRGQIIIPLSSDGGPTLVPLLASTSYNSETYIAPWTGAGGVLLNPAGAMQFNNGNSVIPISVLPAVDPLDEAYHLNSVQPLRSVDLDATYGTSLSSWGNITITTDKKLVLNTLHDLEITATRGAGYLGTSALRYVVSNVRSGEYVPDFSAATTDIHNAPSNADFPLTSATRNITWPFSCDAAEEEQIGGFKVSLDGLMAYI